MNVMGGFSARFNLWVGDERATRDGYKYYCPFKVERYHNMDAQWCTSLQPSGNEHFPMSTRIDLLLSNMTIIGETFLHAMLNVRDDCGQPIAGAQIVKFWLPSKKIGDDYTSSVDEMFLGYPVPGESGKPGDWRMAPAVLVSTIYPYWES